MKLTLLIPCFNESDNISQLYEQLCIIQPELEQRGGFELVLVDDGSSDDTFARLSNTFATWTNAKIVQHERNRGLGAALRTGFTHARGDVIVTTDSDGTYPFTT